MDGFSIFGDIQTKNRDMKKLFSYSFNPAYLDVFLLFARIAIGCLMLTHGLPKMSKMFAGNYEFADPIGLGQKASLIMTVLTEVVFSVLLIIGLFSRVALFGLIFTFAVIVLVVHGPDPLGDKETPILYLLFFVLLFVTGCGKYSLDYLISRRLKN